MGRNRASLLVVGTAHVLLTLALGVSIGYIVGRSSIGGNDGPAAGNYDHLPDQYEASNAPESELGLAANASALSLQRTARETQAKSPIDKAEASLLRGKVDVTPAPASAPSSAWGSDGHRAATERPTSELTRATPSPSHSATPAPTLASPPQPTYWPTYEPTASASPRPITFSPSEAPTRGPSTAGAITESPAIACSCAPTLEDGANSPTAIQTSSPTAVPEATCEPLLEETCCSQPTSMAEGDQARVCLALGCSLSECPSSVPSREPTPIPSTAEPATSSPSVKPTSSPLVETPQPSANPSTESVTTIPTKPTYRGDDTLRPTSPFPTMSPAVNNEAATTTKTASPTEAKKTCKPSHEAACCNQPESTPEADKVRVCEELGCSLAECPESPTDAPTPRPSSASLATTSEPSAKPTSPPSNEPTSSSPTPSPSAESTTLRPSFGPSSEPPFFTTLPTKVPPSPRDTLRPTTSFPTVSPISIAEVSSQPTSEATPGSTPTVSKETTAPPTLPARRDDASTQQDTDVTHLGSGNHRPVYTSNVETACSAPERVGGDACVLRCTETTKLYEGSTLMGVWSSSFESACPDGGVGGPSVHSIEHTIRNGQLNSARASAKPRMNEDPYRVFHSFESEPGKVLEDASKHLFKGSASEAEYDGPDDQLVYTSERSFEIGEDELNDNNEAQSDDYYPDY